MADASPQLELSPEISAEFKTDDHSKLSLFCELRRIIYTLDLTDFSTIHIVQVTPDFKF